MNYKTTVVLFLFGFKIFLFLDSVCAEEAFRIGYTPNARDAAALYSRQVKIHEASIGTQIDWRPFQASSSAISAIQRGDLDAAYVDPFPLLRELAGESEPSIVIISGAASGGYGLVVRDKSELRVSRDFIRTSVGIPEWWSLADFLIRAWLRSCNVSVDRSDALVKFLAIPEVEQLEMLRSKRIDSVFGFEPWLSVAVARAGASRLDIELPDLKYNLPSSVLIVSSKLYATQAEKVLSLVRGHVEAIQSISRVGDKALVLIQAQIKEDTDFDLTLEEIKSAMSITTLSWLLKPADLEVLIKAATKLKYLKPPLKLDRFLKLDLLEKVLQREKISLKQPLMPQPYQASPS